MLLFRSIVQRVTLTKGFFTDRRAGRSLLPTLSNQKIDVNLKTLKRVVYVGKLTGAEVTASLNGILLNRFHAEKLWRDGFDL